jgi:hypothetical protein
MPRHLQARGFGRALLIVLVGLLLGLMPAGCGRKVAPPEPEAKVRLTRLLRLYKAYVERNRNGPPNEQALKEFGQKLSSKERDEYLIGDDLDSIFTSPRDNQKFAIQFNLNIDSGGETRAVAWEATGKANMRYVALSIGYVEEYDDETFQQYRR